MLYVLCVFPVAKEHVSCILWFMKKLAEYIAEVGDEKAAAMFGVKTRTAKSWRLGDRYPRPEQAKVIVENSPVTYEGIYLRESNS